MRNLEGIVVPLMTPLLSPGDRLDVAGLERLLNHVVEGGVKGVFVLGTTGEAPALSYRLRRELISQTCRLVNGRVPIVVGITDTSVTEAIALGCHAAEAGVEAVVTSTPYYFPPDQRELSNYVKILSAAVPLPFIIYNIPQMTKVWFARETVRELMQLEKVVGIKDSSGDTEYLNDLLAMIPKRAGWLVYAGQEHSLVNCVQRGGAGGVTGGANIWPELYAGIYEAAKSGENTKLASLQAQMKQFGQLYGLGEGITAIVKALKAAGAICGLCEETMAQPMASFGGTERKEILRILKETGLIAKGEPAVAS
jgi:dihydrodipicolinate synthase/N-acetylneuraminate lyase